MNVASISSGNANVSERLGALNSELIGLRSRLRERHDEISRMQAARCSDEKEISKLRERINTMASANASESKELERKIRESKVILTDDGASGWLGAERAAYAEQQSSVTKYEARVRKQEQEISHLRNTLQVNHMESEELKQGLQVYKEDANRARQQHAVVAEQLTATSNRLQQLSQSWEGEKARDAMVMVELRKENERLRKENAMLSSGLMEADKRWRKAKEEIRALKLTGETRTQLVDENQKLKERLAEAKSSAKVMAGLAIAGAKASGGGDSLKDEATKAKEHAAAKAKETELLDARSEILNLRDKVKDAMAKINEDKRERVEAGRAFAEKTSQLSNDLEVARKRQKGIELELKNETQRRAEIQKRYDDIIARFDSLTSETRGVIQKATQRAETLEDRLKDEIQKQSEREVEMGKIQTELEAELSRVRKEAGAEKKRATEWQSKLSAQLASLSSNAKEAVQAATTRATALEEELSANKVSAAREEKTMRNHTNTNVGRNIINRRRGCVRFLPSRKKSHCSRARQIRNEKSSKDLSRSWRRARRASVQKSTSC